MIRKLIWLQDLLNNYTILLSRFTTSPTMYHLSTYFSVEIIYISIVYTTVPLTFKVFSIFYLPIGLPHSIGLNINHGLHPSLLTCSFCVPNLNTCTIHSNTSAWNLSHPWSFLYHPEGAWHGGSGGNGGGGLNSTLCILQYLLYLLLIPIITPFVHTLIILPKQLQLSH